MMTYKLLKDEIERLKAENARLAAALDKVRGFGRADMGHQQMCDYVTEAAEEALTGNALRDLLKPTMELLRRHITCHHEVAQWNCSACAADVAYRVELSRLEALTK